MRAPIALVIGLSVAAPVRQADACSCAAVPPLISPADGATSVPINARVIVRFQYGAGSVVLRDAVTSEQIVLTAESRKASALQDLTMFWGTPTSPLLPNHTYTIVTGDGVSPGSTATFTTGDTTDITPPAFTGIAAMTPETMKHPAVDESGGVCVSTCSDFHDGHISRIHLEYPSPPPDAVYVALQLYQPGVDAVDEVPVSLRDPYLLDFHSCDVQSPVLVPGANYCGRIVAYDVAGNVAGADTELCVAAQVCAPTYGVDGCDLSDECPPDTGHSSGCSTTTSTDGLACFVVAGVTVVVRRRRRRGATRRSAR